MAAVDVSSLPSALPTHRLAVPAFQPQRTRFAAGTATFNRESRRISREEVGTSCSAPLVRARAAGTQRSTSHRSPAHCLPTAWPFPPFSRNEPDSRPELQPLTGKVEESAGRRSVQAAPRRSRAPAPRDGGGRRRNALQRSIGNPSARVRATDAASGGLAAAQRLCRVVQRGQPRPQGGEHPTVAIGPNSWPKGQRSARARRTTLPRHRRPAHEAHRARGEALVPFPSTYAEDGLVGKRTRPLIYPPPPATAPCGHAGSKLPQKNSRS